MNLFLHFLNGGGAGSVEGGGFVVQKATTCPTQWKELFFHQGKKEASWTDALQSHNSSSCRLGPSQAEPF